MVTVGLLVTLQARPGKEDELAGFLASALPMAQAEPETTAWFALKIDDSTFGIADLFPSAAGRQAHLDGPIAAALLQRAGNCSPRPPTSSRSTSWRPNCRPELTSGSLSTGQTLAAEA
jgi:quinol monooxygenase YgiN